MEDFKGTKKEWYIGEHRQNGIQIGCNQSHYVACAYRGGADRTDDETIANAQLIATAPELLALHQKFLDMFSQYDMRPEDELHEYASEVMDVLAKALGKEADNE